jgi:hypothetical protein
MNETVAAYRMNPAEDTILFGDELENGMWVICDEPAMRRPYGKDEDGRLRRQRFRRVTRLRREPGSGSAPEKVVFVAEWVDGYKEVHSYAVTFGWIVKKAPEDTEAT